MSFPRMRGFRNWKNSFELNNRLSPELKRGVYVHFMNAETEKHFREALPELDDDTNDDGESRYSVATITPES